MLNTMRRHGTILALFAAGTTALSAAVYTLTKDIIAEQAALVQKNCSTKWCLNPYMTMISPKSAIWSPMKLYWEINSLDICILPVRMVNLLLRH